MNNGNKIEFYSIIIQSSYGNGLCNKDNHWLKHDKPIGYLFIVYKAHKLCGIAVI